MLRTPRSALLAVAAAALLAAGTADAAYRTEERLELAPGGELVVDVDQGSVVVRGTDQAGARVVVTSKDDDVEERYDLLFQQEPGRVTVRAERRGPRIRSWFGGGRSLHFEIEVPTDTEARVDTAGGSIDVASLRGKARLDTSGGWIKVEDHNGPLSADTSGGSITALDVAGDASLDTSGGAIRAESIRGDLVASTSGGSISVQEVTGDVDASTSGGSIEIRGVGGRVEAETSGGPVTAEFAAGNGAGGSLATSGGSVTAYLDPAVALEIDASSSGGRVTFDLPLTVQGRVSRTSVRGSLNGGGPTLSLRSSGGSVRIKSL